MRADGEIVQRGKAGGFVDAALEVGQRLQLLDREGLAVERVARVAQQVPGDRGGAPARVDGALRPADPGRS